MPTFVNKESVNNYHDFICMHCQGENLEETSDGEVWCNNCKAHVLIERKRASE